MTEFEIVTNAAMDGVLLAAYFPGHTPGQTYRRCVMDDAIWTRGKPHFRPIDEETKRYYASRDIRFRAIRSTPDGTKQVCAHWSIND